MKKTHFGSSEMRFYNRQIRSKKELFVGDKKTATGQIKSNAIFLSRFNRVKTKERSTSYHAKKQAENNLYDSLDDPIRYSNTSWRF
jgi:chromosome condensin MukBEF ATPase and DNA-binding subunit MukB